MGTTRLNIDTQDSSIIAGSGDLKLGAPSGNLVLFGAARTPVSSPAEGTAATTVAGAGTIAIPTGTDWVRVTTAGAVTGVILAAGTAHGQRLTVSLDKDAAGTITMAAAGTSRVGTGVGCVIAVGGVKTFIWDNTDLIWAAS